ncbi:hypothetical protein DL96DRAFT_1622259 [Flagelloscypha sp. PMI_526]|nr:hypothetical protein DL96DRAFT_1622259 [Flagelloscypha sp. PMI_526]
MQIQAFFCALFATLVAHVAPLEDGRGLSALRLVGGSRPLLGRLTGGVGRRTFDDGPDPVKRSERRTIDDGPHPVSEGTTSTTIV